MMVWELPVCADPMVDEIARLAVRQSDDYREDAVMEGCVFQSRRCDPTPSNLKRAGSLEFQGRAVPIVREEWVERDRTAAYIARGDTRPSPRGDGETYVFRDSKSLFMSFKDKDGAVQLRALETALMGYKADHCSAGA